jgi:hypothetical protein
MPQDVKRADIIMHACNRKARFNASVRGGQADWWGWAKDILPEPGRINPWVIRFFELRPDLFLTKNVGNTF